MCKCGSQSSGFKCVCETRHIHHDAIVAWANGEKIEQRLINSNGWEPSPFPSWAQVCEYRVKPEGPNYGEVAKAAWNDAGDSPRHLRGHLYMENWTACAAAVIEAYNKENGK